MNVVRSLSLRGRSPAGRKPHRPGRPSPAGPRCRCARAACAIEHLEPRRLLSVNPDDATPQFCSCPSCMPGLAPAPADLLDFGTGLRSQAISSPSADARANALLSGYRWGTSTISFSFFAGGRYYGTETSPGQVSDAVKANVRHILNEIIAPVINVTFNEVADTPTSYGLIRVLKASNPSYAYAYYPTGADFNRGDARDQSGDVVLGATWDVDGSNPNNFRNGPGSHGFMSLVHELGHALGLKHPGNYGASGPFLPLGEDNGDNTLMTYNFSSGKSPSTPMAYDLLALQHLYGAKTATRSGDTTYAFTAVDRFSPGSGSTGTPTPIFDNTKHTLWDGGGTDTIDVSALPAEAGGYRIDVRPGGWITRSAGFNARGYNATTGSTTTFTSGSAFFATDFGTRMALSGAVMENIVVSRSGDAIFLNDAANRVSGYAPGVSNGNDVIHGSNQLDTLDLSLFRQPDVGATQVGSDLVLTLGATGSVTIKDYHAVTPSQRIAIAYRQTEPDAPTIATLAPGDGQVGLTWTAPAYTGNAALTDYVVQHSRDGGGTWTTFVRPVSAATSATVTGLDNGTSYVFRVAAVNGVGTGAYSAVSVAAMPVTSRPVFTGLLTTVGITRVSTDAAGGQANGSSTSPVFSPDGTQVSFTSLASNLVPDDTDGAADLFVKDLATGAITRVGPAAAPGPGVEPCPEPVRGPDGTKAAFFGAALEPAPGGGGGIELFLQDLATGAIVRLTPGAAAGQGNTHCSRPAFSPDGTKLAFVSNQADLVAGDTNATEDVFIAALGFVVSVGEGSTAVATFGATDRDPDTTVVHALGGPDAARFTIDAATGQVWFLSPPDFDSPADAGADNVYDIVVSATGGLFTTTVPARISVTPVAADDTVTVAAGEVVTDTNVRTGGARLVKRGPGTLVLDLANAHSGGTVVEAGEVVVRNASGLGTGTVVVGPGARLTLDTGAAAVSLAGLDLHAGGLVDVGTGRIALAPGSFDLATIRGHLAAGRDAGTWAGSTGIASSSAAITPGRGVGHVLDGGGLVVGYAAFGDLNLDGAVDFDDTVAFVGAGLFDSGLPGAWDTGDFDYDGAVDFDDVLAMLAADLYDQGSYLPGGPAAAAPAQAASPAGLDPTAAAFASLAVEQPATGEPSALFFESSRFWRRPRR